jgi:hypothetical protein
MSNLFVQAQAKHVTSNDLLISAELNQRKAEVIWREKDLKSWMEYHVRRKAALPSVDRLKNELENSVGRLKSKGQTNEVEIFPSCLWLRFYRRTDCWP